MKNPFKEQFEKNKKIFLEEGKEWRDANRARLFPDYVPPAEALLNYGGAFSDAVKQNVSKIGQDFIKESQEWRAGHTGRLFSKKGNLDNAQMPQPVKKLSIKRRPVWISLASAAAALVLILGLYFMWPLFFPPDTVRDYYKTNFVEVYSDITELNSYIQIQGLRIVLDDGQTLVTHVSRIYAKEYNQTLFFNFRFACEDGIKVGRIISYVHPPFTPQERFFLSVTEAVVGGFNVTFCRQYEYTSTYTVISYLARLEHNSIIMYIEYTQRSLAGYSDFFDFIKNVIRII